MLTTEDAELLEIPDEEIKKLRDAGFLKGTSDYFLTTFWKVLMVLIMIL